MEEEIVVIDLDSVGQKINEGEENNLGNLESNLVTLGNVGAVAGQSMESPEFINKIDDGVKSDNLTETEFQPLGESGQPGIFNQEAPFEQNNSELQTNVETLTSTEQKDLSQPQAIYNSTDANSQIDTTGNVVSNQNNAESPRTNNQGVVLPSIPGQAINNTALPSANDNANNALSEDGTGNSVPAGVNPVYDTLPDSEVSKTNQTITEKIEESPRIIQGFQNLAQNVSRGIQNIAQNLGLAPESPIQTPPQDAQATEPGQKSELSGPVYQKLLTAVSTGVFYNDDGTTFYAKPGTQAYETAVENIKAKVNKTEEPIYDENGVVVNPTAMVNQISQIANRVLSQGVAQVTDQAAAQNAAIAALANTTQATAQDVAENVAQEAAQRAVQGALQNSNVDSVQDVVQNILQGTAQNATTDSAQEVIQNAASIADKITEQIADQNVLQQVAQDVSRAVTQNALQTAEQIAEGSIQEVSQITSAEAIQGVIKESITAATQTAGESLQETTQALFDNVQDAAKEVVRDSVQSEQKSQMSDSGEDSDVLKQITYQELAQAAGASENTEAIQELNETLEKTESTLDTIEQAQNNRISIQRAGQIPGDNLGSGSQPQAGFYNEDGTYVEQLATQLNQQGPNSIEQIQLSESQGIYDSQGNYLEPQNSTAAGQSVEGATPNNQQGTTQGTATQGTATAAEFESAATQVIQEVTKAADQVAQTANQITNQTGQAQAASPNSPEMVSLPEIQQKQLAQQISDAIESNSQGTAGTANTSGTNLTESLSESGISQTSKIYSVSEQTETISQNTQDAQADSSGRVTQGAANENLNQTTYSSLPESPATGSTPQEQTQRRRDRINLTSTPTENVNATQSTQDISVQTNISPTDRSPTDRSALNDVRTPIQPTQNGAIFDATIQSGNQSVDQQEINVLQQVTLPQTGQITQPDSDLEPYESSVPRLFATNRRASRLDSINEDSIQQPGRINLSNALQPRDIEKISEQIISEGFVPQAPEAPGLNQFDYQGLEQQPGSLNPVITGVNASGASETEEEDEDGSKLKSVKYITVGGDTLMKTEVPKNEVTDASTVQQIKEALSTESIIYQELLKERERFRANLEAERGNNRANLRRAEQQIQQELVKVITEQPMEAESENSSPINQIIQSIIKEDREVALERETESIQNTIQNVQERQEEANKVAQKETLEAIRTSQEKAPEKVFIDATKIIQMIQEKQKENESAKEIDEFLLRQRIERELKYEFNQMQIDHEKKLRSVYRRMIEQMYLDMLNS